jgi:4-amino-4-deoxy-L-arabinose transferase-like glycosyltransferase
MERRASPIADSTAVALATIAVLGVLYALIARCALDAFPYSGDEYSGWLQAQLFARGLLKAPAPEHIEWLRVDHVVIDGWVRSKYPPGGPALLSLGARAGVGWLVTPVEAVVALVLVWHTARRLLGRREGLVALVTLGLAPLFVVQAASFYAHTATTMFLAIAFAAVASWCDDKRHGWLVLAGTAIGCAFLTRPLDAVLFGAAMLAFRSPVAVIVTAVSALPWVLLNFAYQAAQFGSPFTDGYRAYEPTIIQLYGPDMGAAAISLANLVSPLQLWNHVDVFRAMTVDWTIAGAVVVALFGAVAIGRDHRARPMRTFAISLIAAYAIALLFTVADPDDGARPRYLSITLIPIAFLAAGGFASARAAIASRFGRRAGSLAAVVAVVFALAQVGSFLQMHIPRLWRREGLYKITAALDRSAIVIVRARYPSRYARNGPFFDGVEYLSVPADTSVQAVRAAFPNRQIWEAHEGEPWTLNRVP